MKNKQSFFKRFLVAFIGLFSVVSTSSLVACSSTMYSITMVNENEDAGTLLGEGKYKAGSEVSISYSANKGYKFAKWDIDGEVVKTSSKTYQFKMPSKDIVVKGSFEPKLYKVEARWQGECDNNFVITGEGTYAYGDDVTISINFNDTLFTAEWRIDGAKIADTDSSITFKMPAKDVDVECETTRNRVKVYFSSNISGYSGFQSTEEGYVGTLPTFTNDACLYVNGGSLLGIINPDTGHNVSTKKVEVKTASGTLLASNTYEAYDNTCNAYIDTTDEDLYVDVTFCDRAYVVFAWGAGGSIGSDFLTSPRYRFYGDQYVMYAKPDPGFHFVGWYENDVLYSEDSTVTYTITKDATFEVRFSK